MEENIAFFDVQQFVTLVKMVFQTLKCWFLKPILSESDV